MRARAATSDVDSVPSTAPTKRSTNRVAKTTGSGDRLSPSICRYSFGIDATAPANKTR